MARVNHKLVKQRLNEKRSKITNRQFFTSRILAGHYEDIAAAQTRRYHYNRRVRVQIYWKPKCDDIAMTDNMVININAGHKMVTDIKDRVEQYNIVTGLFAHELGHVLYTDFLASQTYAKYFLDNRWYPYPPVYLAGKDALNESDMWEYVKADELNRRAVLKLLHTIENILEDGYIENRMMAEFPGILAYGLECVRGVHFAQIDNVSDLKEKEEDGRAHIFTSLMQVLLSYAKFGEIKYGDEPFSDVRIKTIFDLLPEIDTAVASRSIKDRMNVSNLFLIRCWEYAKEYCELCKAAQEAAKDCGIEEEIESVLSGALNGSMSGLSNEGEGNSIPVSGDSGKSNTQTESNRQKIRAIAASAKQDEAESEEKNDDAEGQGEAEEQSEDENESDGKQNGGGEDQNDEEQDGGETQSEDGADESQDGSTVQMLNQGKQEVQSDELGRIPLEQTDSVYEPTGEGEVEYDDEYQRENYDKSASDINRLLESMAEKSACEELENERLSELNEMAQSISYGDIHRGVNKKVHRITTVDEELIEYYNEVSAPLIAISKQLQKNLLRQLKDMRLGGKLTGLMMGRRLDCHALHRNDGKVFYKNNLPQDVPQLAVGLLLDESGSMSSADRATYARAAAIILYDFCQSLEIPVTVYGHTTSYDSQYHSTVDLYSYAEFDSIDKNDKYRLMDISARGSNRDGAALRFVAEKLVARPETVKMLILVSDGQPADFGYDGTAAEEDLRGIKQEYQRKGITFIAAAIGSDKANIERIYGDSFWDITDLNQLPVKLTTVVKRHIRT